MAHLTSHNCHVAELQNEEYRRALSTSNELLSLLTSDRHPLEPTSANHGFFFLLLLSYTFTPPSLPLRLHTPAPSVLNHHAH